MFTDTLKKPVQTVRSVALSPLKWIPEQTVCPIITGHLRGMKWIIGSSRKACWLGVYESHFQTALYKQLKPSMVFYDIGANVGFYSLFASQVLPQGTIYSFEPVPRNIAYLRRHLALNGVQNVHVLEIALSEQDGHATFEECQDHASGHLGPGTLQVRTRSIDSLLQWQEIPPPHCVKIDVEGEEVKVLLGARVCLSQRKPIVFLATHSDQLHKECRNILESFDYVFSPMKAMDEGRADILAKPRNDTHKE
jgi:FkbM family methyltransferase